MDVIQLEKLSKAGYAMVEILPLLALVKSVKYQDVKNVWLVIHQNVRHVKQIMKSNLTILANILLLLKQWNKWLQHLRL